ncbi:TPA: MFS transporter [Listeria monocytogenes]|nr:MFS transporter [Listeria monocytogenes]
MIKNQRSIIYLILGQGISVFGGAILRFSLSLFVLDQTGRADIFATVLAISSIPILFGPIGGAIADRFNRRLLMVLMDVANAVLALLLFFVLGMNQSIVLIGALLFILSIVSSFDTPVVTASIPLLVEESELEKVNGLVSGILSMSTIVAPIVGGVLYSLIGAQVLVISCTIFFFFAAVIECFIPIPFENREWNHGWLKTLTTDLKEGFREVCQNQVILKSILIAASVNFVLASFFIVGTPVILRLVLQVNDLMYGIGMSIVSLSTILGSIFAGYFTKKLRLNNLYLTFTLSGLLLFAMNGGLTFAGNSFGNIIGFFLFVITGVAIGMLMSIVSIYLISMVQRATSKENLGKVMATFVACVQCAVPLGQLMIGRLFNQTTANVFLPMVLIASAILVISVVCYYLFRQQQKTNIQ